MLGYLRILLTSTRSDSCLRSLQIDAKGFLRSREECVWCAPVHASAELSRALAQVCQVVCRSGLDTEFVCVACAEEREKGISTEAAFVCEECFQYATTEVGDLVRTGGQPEIRVLSEPFGRAVCETPIPNECKKIIDIAPIKHDSRSTWLLLGKDGELWRFDAQNGAAELVARTKVPSEVAGDAFAGHTLTTRLHATQDGVFAAVLNDYGRHGQVIDLRSGKTTLKLDGGDYHPETVPFLRLLPGLEKRLSSIGRHGIGWTSPMLQPEGFLATAVQRATETASKDRSITLITSMGRCT